MPTISPITRRQMLGASLATLGIGLSAQVFATEITHLEGGLAMPAGRGCTVVVDLVGGNDGFNTVIPYADPAYAAARPGLAIASADVIPLDARCGLHPALRPLMSAWDHGQVAVLHGLGIAGAACHDSARSAWRTGGWASCAPTLSGSGAGIAFAGGAGPLAGCGLAWTCVDDAEHVQDFVVTTAQAGAALRARMAATAVSGNFPATRLGRELAQSARLLASGATPAAIVVSHEGYDTHSDQRDVHDRLLSELAQALAAFRSALVAAGRWQDVLVLTTSEFGRALHENAAGGTEHGTTSVQLALGGRVRGGVFGAAPSLDRGTPAPTAQVHEVYGRLFRDFHSMAPARRVEPAAAFARIALV